MVEIHTLPIAIGMKLVNRSPVFNTQTNFPEQDLFIPGKRF